MNIPDFNPEVVAVKFAGVVGAFVSMAFLKGSLLERVTSAVGGAAASYYAGPWVSSTLGLPEGLSGFLVGLFGMAVLSRAWEWVQSTPISALWAWALEWLPRRKKTDTQK